MNEPKKKKSALFWVVIAGGGCLVLVACSGILAAIAIPSFVKYTNQSKAAEARANLQTLAYEVESRCELTQQLPGAAGPVPAGPPGPEKRIGDFQSDPVFAELGFAPMDSLYYRYGIRPSGAGSVTLYAEGDLDGDGTLGGQSFTCTGPPVCTCAPDVLSGMEELE